ncbi:MAG: geranylgeranyl reductase family protein [Hydrogenobacter thermophilus]|uniref:geranylgeranyl reductase family protein n=1 Tax=Hydrogenobacter thermophilus TaxID=940 RepID=UPI0030F73184|nr:geranylgeranyl reductase family protein [Hydrogenobacter thermophilus]
MYDLVVVGGGPAGSSCAYHASKNGLKVLLLEKHKVPRFKLCAGCLSKRISSHLPDGWEKLVLNRIRGGVLGYSNKESFELLTDREIAYIVDRAEFDAFLLEKAQEEGVEVLQECEVLSIEANSGKCKVITSKGSFYADFLVGADGFYSTVAKALGYKKSKFFKSLEFFTFGDLVEKVIIDIGWVKRGYAWVFPKGDRLSVGIACREGGDLSKNLFEYAKTRGIKIDGRVYGWHIPYMERERDVFYGAGRVLLVGDAANLTDPLLGEGIYYAVLSGKLAVQAIAESPSEPLALYRELLKGLVSELVYAGKIASLGYRFQKVAYSMSKKGMLKHYYRLLTGELSYRELYIKGWFYFLKELVSEYANIYNYLRR